MATNREMLKEAIADAKAVKETAIANAKAALEEAFTPQLKSMFAAKLQEIETDPEVYKDEYVTDKTEHDDKPYSAKDAAKLTKFEPVKEEDKDMMEVDLEELLAELNEEEEMEGLYEAEEEEEDDMEMSDEESEEGEEEGEPLDLEDLTDEDLKDMIEDVIKDMIEKGELEAGHEGEESEESEEGEEDEVIDLAELLKEIEEMEDMGYMEEEKEPMDEIDLGGVDQATAALATALPFLIGAGALFGSYLKHKLKGKSASEQAKITKDILANPEKYKAEAEATKSQTAVTETSTEMDSELEEAYSTIDELKSELNEINLLNAKLLYTNKIFKAKNLNESQKVKVLTSFDKAKNVGEVKMVFETLNEGIKVSKNIIKENLGRASKGTMTPNVNKPIVESNEAFLRMQKLAGII
jgi:hypothetical protein